MQIRETVKAAAGREICRKTREDAIDEDLLRAVEETKEDGQVVLAGRDVKVGAVPDEVGMNDAVGGEGFAYVEDRPLRVVEGRGGVGGVVALMDEPARGDVDGVVEVGDGDAVGVNWRMIGGTLGVALPGERKGECGEAEGLAERHTGSGFCVEAEGVQHTVRADCGIVSRGLGDAS